MVWLGRQGYWAFLVDGEQVGWIPIHSMIRTVVLGDADFLAHWPIFLILRFCRNSVPRAERKGRVMPLIEYSIPAMLADRAQQQPDDIAYTYIDYEVDPAG